MKKRDGILKRIRQGTTTAEDKEVVGNVFDSASALFGEGNKNASKWWSCIAKLRKAVSVLEQNED